MFNKIKYLVIVAALVLLVTVTLSVNAKQAGTVELGAPQNFSPIHNKSEDGLTMSKQSDPRQAAYLREYWTPERMMAAEPMPWPTYSEENEGRTQGAAESLGEPGFSEGKMPRAGADRAAKIQYPAAWETPYGFSAPDAELGEDYFAADDFGTANVFTSYLTNKYLFMWKKYPYKAVGKLYITGGGYCSASVISPRTIVTAAHCVYDRSAGKWYDGWTFVPAYRDGTAPYGTFPDKVAWMLTAYQTTGLRKYDVAVIVLRANSAGKRVSYYTGYLGRAWNFGYTNHLHAEGYPSNLYSGKYTYTCAAETLYGGSTDVIGMGCNMTFGSSGGPWIMKFHPGKSGAFNFVNSVVSGGNPANPTFYGPRFHDGNIKLLCDTAPCD